MWSSQLQVSKPQEQRYINDDASIDVVYEKAQGQSYVELSMPFIEVRSVQSVPLGHEQLVVALRATCCSIF